MRRALLFILFFLFNASGLFAQRKKVVTVKAGDNIMDVLPVKEVFYYPVFTNGKVIRKDGTLAEGKMNYNRLVDEIHFIGANGDTLALAGEGNIKYVVIENDTFCFDQGYLRLLKTGNRARLAVKQIWVITNTRQLGAYNSTNSSAVITSYTSYGEGGRLYDLTVNADVVLTKVEQFYLSSNNGPFFLADKKNLLTQFPEKWNMPLETYLKENKIDFANKEDLEKVVRFLEQL